MYFSIELESLLLEFYDYCKEKLKKYENREIANDDYIFMRDEMDEPTPMTPNTFTWRFKLILKKNNMPKELNVHSLRHSNASLLIASGVDVTTVAGLLGHAQPSTTLDIYSHAFDDNKRRAHEGLQEELEL